MAALCLVSIPCPKRKIEERATKKGLAFVRKMWKYNIHFGNDEKKYLCRTFFANLYAFDKSPPPPFLISVNVASSSNSA